MKQRFRKLLSLAAAGVLAVTLFVTPAAAADAAENGNEAFDRWAAEAAIAERQRMEQLTGLPEDPQAAFEEAAAILEAIENARVMTPIADNEPALIDRIDEPLENETPEKLWAEFVAQFGGGSELSDEEEFPYELRFFTVTGEERFAIYDTRSGRAAAGWQGSTGKWVNGLQYTLLTEKDSETIESYYLGENVKAIIVFNKNCTDTQNLTLAQKKQVLRHELGHAIGLRHTFNTDYGETEPGITALMHPNIDSAYSSLTFTDYDMGELNKVYP